MITPLPTGVFGSWAVTSMRDSLIAELADDDSGKTLTVFFYAVTGPGWSEFRKPIRRWSRADTARKVVAYVGTDHALTDPDALVRMVADGVTVRLMQEYQGVFHPKVVWLEGDRKHVVWAGSNNLTKDGLLNNIEFALVARATREPAELAKWAAAVHDGSSELTEGLAQSYRRERQAFAEERAKSRIATFTWSKKKEPARTKVASVKAGDLIVEVMPRETGDEGRQLQLPVTAAGSFFGLVGVGSTRAVRLRSVTTKEVRDLTMTVFANNTVRVQVGELEYRDRPCMIVFRKSRGGTFTFEIVPQNIFPGRYKTLLASCVNQTRSGSRRWVIV